MIPIENGPRSVPADRHRHPFIDADIDRVAHRAAAKIMLEFPRQSG
jgi:hypothetical protein